VRADAARNLDAVLQTGARLLAEDPSASISAIAAAAGVDRRTVHRRFACREVLRDAACEAKVEAVEGVLTEARLESAPVAVALHRYVEGIIAVIRRYPIDPEQMRCDAESYARMLDQRKRVAAFVQRARDEGFIRLDIPDGVAEGMLSRIVSLLARQYGDHDPARAADIAVDMLLSGVGAQG